MTKKNPVFSFFSSVKLALFTLFLLAVTSIIGTVIPQKETFAWYVQHYSESTAKIFQVLSIPDMYNSWWFLGLLTLLAVNLIVCSFDRFPGVWRQIKADNLATDLKRLPKMRLSSNWITDKSKDAAATELTSALAAKGWKTEQRRRDNGNALLLFAQKGAMTRTGVYIVHASILVIFIGAIIGELYGFKGSVMLPEGKTTSSIFQFGTGKAIDLGFDIRCDRFDIELYDSGMPKAYRSKLTVLEDGNVTLEKEIVVNDPLTYHGITFYQSSYQGYENFILTVTDQQTSKKERVVLPFQQPADIPAFNASVGVINAEMMGQSITRMKIWFNDDKGPASSFWMNAGKQVTVERGDKRYTIDGKQMYATGLQVAKDPGVWVVYIGCGMMVLGLVVAFFMSHRRIWLLLTNENGKTSVLLSGSSNKNKIGFEKSFSSLSDELNTNSDN
ncbi:MAG TPA: cytochrome c biogenesis protein ResB [Desulfobacterales bacterium]|nr:cytochrome c biogenesis protein ResB [Desulfobacterales bacterium]HIP38926.1 cytochrome c biogenesis protein ResB [Desulfocapsa sulfexigens]